MRTKRNAVPVRPAALLGCILVLAMGCTDSNDLLRRDDPGPTQPPGSGAHQITPADLRQIAGVDVLPRLLNAPELAESMKRHYPAALRGHGSAGSVLVDVSIDEQGRVTGVTALPAPTLQAHGLKGSRPDLASLPAQAATPASTVQFGDAARAALGTARFSPAQRDGKPVAFTLRMTVRFSDPEALGTP
jgi:hypothetical protein